MPILGEFPYSDFYIYNIHHKKENRNYIVLVNKNNFKDRTTLSLARYLMSVKEKRILNKNETVDHINNDKSDDRMDNLQILSWKENHKKYTDTLEKRYLKLKCPSCEKIFVKEAHKANVWNGGVFTACSRKCAGIVRQKLQMGVEYDFSDNIVEVFYK